MRYAFIINPISGKRGHEDGIIKNVKEMINKHGDRGIRMYLTGYAGEAIKLASEIALDAEKSRDRVIVFACGGDGTVHEVANGIYGHDSAVLGIVPVGSGNDLCRALAYYRKINMDDYLNLDLQMHGEERGVDVLKITYEEEGCEKSFIAVNSINIGFDGNTAIRANEIKKNSKLSGSFAYLYAVLKTLVKKEGQCLRINADGKLFYDGDLLLTTMGNGPYCGGGIMSCPFAELDSGTMELLTVRDLSRMKFISCFGKFSKGRLFEIPDVDEIAEYRRASDVTIEPLSGSSMRYVVDGEEKETGTIHIKTEPKAMSVWML